MNNELRDLLTFARLEARKCVKEGWRSEGLKLSDWTMFDLRIASEQYLADHWIALKPKAEELLAYSKAQAEARRRSGALKNPCRKAYSGSSQLKRLAMR